LLRHFYVHDIVYHLLLPILIYETAFRIRADNLLGRLVIILVLSIPLMLVAVLITAFLLYWGIGDNHYFPFIAALVAAALLSANDLGAVEGIANKLNLPPHLLAILEGESIFNSLLALVFVSLAFSIDNQQADLSFLAAFILFVKLFSGGIFVGLVCGLLGWLILHYSRHPFLRGLVSLLIAYGTFVLAEQSLDVSGIVAVLVAGLLLNAYAQRTEQRSRDYLNKQWQIVGESTTILLFLLVGISLYLPIIFDQWQIVLWSILVVLLARALIVFAGLWSLGWLIKDYALPLKDRTPLFWGGIKGAVAIALVLSLPGTLDYSYTIQAMIYGVVLFGLFIQAPTLHLVCRYCSPSQKVRNSVTKNNEP
ncbi:MAG: cation:proton antiporter, partial [bacterium]